MQSGPISSNEQTRQTVFQQLQALLRDDYDNCKGLLPGEACYILAKKSIPFMIQYLSLESEDPLTQIRKTNAFLLQAQEHNDFSYFQGRFKGQVSLQAGDDTFKVKAICKTLYESLSKEIDLKGIAVERRTKKRGIDLHPFRMDVVIMSGKSMKEVQEEVNKSKLVFQEQMVFQKIRLHVYENESIDSILCRLGKTINKKGKEMRLYHLDDSLFQHCSFSRMIEYFLFKEDTQAANEEQSSFYALEENRISLDQDYLLEFFPGKLMRGESAAQMAEKGDKYVLELKEEGWTFPEQPEFSIAENCRFCMMKMQLYIMFSCQKCNKEALFCSRVCHYEFLLEHPCKNASKKQISTFYGEEYLTEDEKQPRLLKSRTETTRSHLSRKYSYSQSANAAALSTGNFGGGLANIINSCYLNASIQNLIRTSLTDQLLALEGDITRDEGKPLAKAYLVIIRRLQKTTAKESLNQKVMKQFKRAIDIKMPQFSGQQQHDAHEFLTFFLDALGEQLNTNSQITQQIKPINRGDTNNDLACNQWLKFISKNHSPIVSLFYGQLKSQIYCPHCHSYSNRYQSFHIISLSITADRIQKQQTLTVDFFFEYHLFRDKIKYLQLQTAGYLVKDLIQEALPSLNFVPDRRYVIKAYKLGYEGDCVELEGRMKISLLKEALARPRQAQDQLFLIQAPRDSFPLYFKFLKNKQTITYKRPLFFSQPYSKLRNIKIYSTVADYLLGMARNYLCRNMAEKKKMEELAKRINRNIAQYFTIKVVVRKGYVEEEYELIPNAEVSNLIGLDTLLEVEILDFQHVSETQKAFSEHLVRLNRYTKVNQVEPNQKQVAKTPKSIQECVKEQFSRIELLSNGNEWFCEACNQKRRVRQTIHLYKANRYLFFQIKRFRQGTDGRYFKNLRKVKVEMQLDLAGILENPHLPEEYYQHLKDEVREGFNLPQALDLTKSYRFQLIGMVLHEGSITRGHYTAIFKHGGNQGEWFKYNDEFVTEIKDMANLLEEPEIMERLYILLYQRIS